MSINIKPVQLTALDLYFKDGKPYYWTRSALAMCSVLIMEYKYTRGDANVLIKNWVETEPFIETKTNDNHYLLNKNYGKIDNSN